MWLNLYESLDLNFISTAIILTTNSPMHTSLDGTSWRPLSSDTWGWRDAKVWSSRPNNPFYNNDHKFQNTDVSFFMFDVGQLVLWMLWCFVITPLDKCLKSPDTRILEAGDNYQNSTLI